MTEQHQARPQATRQQLERLDSIDRTCHLVPLPGEHILDDLAKVGLVLDHEDDAGRNEHVLA